MGLRRNTICLVLFVAGCLAACGIGTFSAAAAVGAAQADPAGVAPGPVGTAGDEPVARYEKSTPQQNAAAIARARERAKDVATRLGLKLAEVETDQFIVFTDWPAADHPFLRTNLRAAYAAVARQFDLPPRGNVFVGKLPVYMFARQADFQRFAADIDETGGAVAQALGYYRMGPGGVGHLVMWKPEVSAEGGDLDAARRKWARVLVHEFTHAFVHRYRSNAHVPRWLNEGIAEVIANELFPEPRGRPFARLMATEAKDLSALFDDEIMPGGEAYPVMQTMTEMLIREDRRRFIELFNRIKNGDKPEQTLQALYGVDYEGLVAAWRDWIKRTP